MRDRQLFEKTVLPNGITLYTYSVDAPIACLEIQVPTGAAHSHAKNGFLPGSVHFLEHMQHVRSRNYPEPHQLDHELGLRGCHFNGTTFRSKTTYWIDAPVDELDFAIEALIDRIYHPIFRAPDIITERTVVSNERQREQYYPGRTKVNQYYSTEFMHDVPYPLEQIFGSDQDLSSINVNRLERMHRVIAYSSGTVVIAVGDSKFEKLKAELSKIRTSQGLLDKKMADTYWADPAFRLVPLDTVARPTLELAWIHPRVSYKERVALDFIINLLTNYVHGSLFTEYRKKRGWTYSINSYLTSHRQTIFGLSFPLNSVKQIDHVRNSFYELLEKSINNQALVEKEIKRRKNLEVYSYQTVASIMSGASHDLIGNKKIYSETEWRSEVAAMAEPGWRHEISEHYFKKAAMGEIGFVPTK